ncbi:MAG TPA: class II aldolase/adducin family protein [Candidatus Limiplasma sp.]|nr:class II aldolase/adducin family protein [Candidatus Limiplasma sp.]
MNIETAQRMQQQVCRTAKDMAAAGLTAGTWGNISARIDDDFMVITPSGMDYAGLTPGQMVIVSLQTLAWEGALKPSIEVPMHAKILSTRPGVNAVVHTHSTAALTVAAAQKGIPPICDDQVQILGGDIRCAAYTVPGTQAMADAVAEALRDRAGALIANHGAVALGRTLQEALIGAIVLEKTARVYLDVQRIGGAVPICDADCLAFHDFFLHKYGQQGGR